MIKAKGMTYPRTMLSNGSAKALHNSCIDLEQIITSHAWFAWYSGRDDDHVTSFQSFSKVFFPSKSLHLKETRTRSSKNITKYNSSCRQCRHLIQSVTFTRESVVLYHPCIRGEPPRKPDAATNAE